MEDECADTVVGNLMIPLALLALSMVAPALHPEMSVFGWSLAGFAGLFGTGVIRRHHDRRDAAMIPVRVRDDHRRGKLP